MKKLHLVPVIFKPALAIDREGANDVWFPEIGKRFVELLGVCR